VCIVWQVFVSIGIVSLCFIGFVKLWLFCWLLTTKLSYNILILYMAKTIKTIHIGLHLPHVKVVEKIEQSGFLLSEVIRNLIIQYGVDHFPEEKAYAKAALLKAEATVGKIAEEKAFESMSDKDYAEKELRGTVKGNFVYFMRGTGGITKLPLIEIKKYNTDNHISIKMHQEILDKIFITGDDKVITESTRDSVIKSFEDIVAEQ